MSMFITATGTNTGKTFATCALLHALPKWRAVKPIVSGFGTGDCDTTRLHDAMGGRYSIEAISPWRFSAPISPDMAAAREGKPIDFDALVGWCKQQAADGHTLIEGVGGAMVPLTQSHTSRDWMLALGLPILLIGSTELGSLSHTLSTLEALDTVGLAPRALIVSESTCAAVPLAEHVATLARFTDALIVAQPRVSSPQEAHAIHALAKEWA